MWEGGKIYNFSTVWWGKILEYFSSEESRVLHPTQMMSGEEKIEVFLVMSSSLVFNVWRDEDVETRNFDMNWFTHCSSPSLSAQLLRNPIFSPQQQKQQLKNSLIHPLGEFDFLFTLQNLLPSRHGNPAPHSASLFCIYIYCSKQAVCNLISKSSSRVSLSLTPTNSKIVKTLVMSRENVCENFHHCSSSRKNIFRFDSQSEAEEFFCERKRARTFFFDSSHKTGWDRSRVWIEEKILADFQ